MTTKKIPLVQVQSDEELHSLIEKKVQKDYKFDSSRKVGKLKNYMHSVDVNKLNLDQKREKKTHKSQMEDVDTTKHNNAFYSTQKFYQNPFAHGEPQINVQALK